MQAHLCLIGTVHHDPRGYEKLHALLSVLKPDLITLELSSYGRGFRTRHSNKLSRKLLSLYKKIRTAASQPGVSPDSGLLPSSVATLLGTINYPFEFLAARDYAHICRIPFYCIDLSRLSRLKMQLLKQEALNKNNIAMLLTLSDKNLQESVELCYKRAENIWHANICGSRAAVTRHDSSAVAREAHMSRRIRNLIKRHPNKTLVHIGGWEHISGDANRITMYELLKNLSPQRLLLTDDTVCAITSLPNR